jgi:hypothetical protein
MPGVTHDLMLTGVSVTRNEKLAQIFYHLKNIEAFGTGIPRIFVAYENSDVKPKIPVIDGGFLIRLPNMNYALKNEVIVNKVANGSNEQRLIDTFSDTSFSKEDAADVLGISVSGAYKLLQRMTERGLIVARKEGKRFIYSTVFNQTGYIQESDFLAGKFVAFVGTFDGGSTKLKDLVFAAGGAPTDTIPAFTNYLVIGRNGKEAKAYKEAKRMIDVGAIIELTESELREICAGDIPAPKETFKLKDTVIVSPASKEYELEEKLNEEDVFMAKRAAFVRKYGILQPDGRRNKKSLY